MIYSSYNYTNHTRRERNCSEMTKVCITSEHQLFPIMKQSSVYLDSGVDLPHKQTGSNVPHCPCNHIRTIRYIHVHLLVHTLYMYIYIYSTDDYVHQESRQCEITKKLASSLWHVHMYINVLTV